MMDDSRDLFLAQKFWILKAEEAQITGSVVHRNSTFAGFNFGGQTGKPF